GIDALARRLGLAGNEQGERADGFLLLAVLADLDGFSVAGLDLDEAAVRLDDDAEADVLEAVAGRGQAVVRIFRKPPVKMIQRLENHGGSGVGGVEGWNMEDSILELRVEETRFGADALALAGQEAVLGLFVGGEIGDVVEHPAEFLVELLGRKSALRERITFL